MLYISTILVFIIFIILLNFAYAGVSAAPWVPSRKKDYQRVLELAGIKNGDTVYDLGSGDGRWLFYFAKHSPAQEIRGYEISLIMYLICWIKKLFSGYPQVKLSFGNFYKFNLSKADVLICFLTPRAMKKLLPKLKKEMKPGSRLVSYAFTMPNVEAEKVSKVSQKSVSIYLYRF
ncbi:class I SAM-dependent methyltransferase [Patescibacteria group bacterium]|nr:class I SAM-dependent methyltransferase [Patescibacteria group bacterium]